MSDMVGNPEDRFPLCGTNLFSIYAGNNSHGDRFIVASGSNPVWNERQLPVGLEDDSYVLSVWVEVYDDLGSLETYFVSYVTVSQ